MKLNNKTLGILFLAIVLVAVFGLVGYSQEHEHGKAQQEKKESKSMMGHMDKMIESMHKSMESMEHMLKKMEGMQKEKSEK